ncbi:tetratricopeptide repeat protein [Massilia sp. B-10]|nr:tetratricopeptide repeat protein [Massilia sp. B-10]
MAYAAQGAVRLAQGKQEEALRLIGHSLRLDPLDVFALCLKGDILMRMGRFDDSRAPGQGDRRPPRTSTSCATCWASCCSITATTAARSRHSGAVSPSNPTP